MRAAALTVGPMTEKVMRSATPDVSEHHGAVGKRDSASQGKRGLRGGLLHACKRCFRSLNGTVGRCLEAVDLDGEDGQDRVADEVENVAAGLDHRTGGRVEIGVEMREIDVRCEPVGETGRVAQVGIEDHHVQRLTVPMPDLAGQDVSPATPAQIGLGKRAGDTGLDG